jgi:hypothetical protein
LLRAGVDWPHYRYARSRGQKGAAVHDLLVLFRQIGRSAANMTRSSYEA